MAGEAQVKNSMALEFLSLPENVGLARVAVATFAAQVDMTLNELEEIKVAVSEAVSNAIIHGYRGEPRGIVRVAVERTAAGLVITVEDKGCGIPDVATAMQPAYSTDPERMGLGFAFMQSFMDDLEVTSEVNRGTRVKMFKAFKGEAGK
ncbi:anti-sigma F factor [Moorella sp. E308F]|jgi:stage II sporulation protein AB (anti-sigma F factor)|uniref:anti-sigma F factor n=1 Tax=unclassified Neomoorella TaxID=2676739 RepID=UPI0010FFBE35|nr:MULTISPECIES: anti-sigma F factor [unclassified Moorella (in: firmicutes)]GEA15931.1 anti-sigma F factor [Moorella sp. E308F]GEA19251.1 anti-sigma F factor [Moorella sp. E306M]